MTAKHPREMIDVDLDDYVVRAEVVFCVVWQRSFWLPFQVMSDQCRRSEAGREARVCEG